MSLSVRNVNEAFNMLRDMLQGPIRGIATDEWRVISPRGMKTLEYKGVFCTEYHKPCERVLFDWVRDANPFFHFFEALWILAGRRDVSFVAQFNSNIASFSDDGDIFHGAYGYRLRNNFLSSRYLERQGLDQGPIDQISRAIELLKADHDTRQVVLAIWDAELDIGAKTKDLPCNDLIMLKIRDGALNMTVCCRSNDAVWGAYGANVVQFSTLLEFIARAVGVEVGIYTQVSDSFHVYLDRPDFIRNFSTSSVQLRANPYDYASVKPFPLMSDLSWEIWLGQCEDFCNGDGKNNWNWDPYFERLAFPMLEAWKLHKSGRTVAATEWLSEHMAACDWKEACTQWLARRVK